MWLRGLTTPTLFNIYVNRLIDELSSTGIGCHIDGLCVNNICYTDDTVLLSLSISALPRLLNEICESCAVTGITWAQIQHEKSEVIVLRLVNKYQ